MHTPIHKFQRPEPGHVKPKLSVWIDAVARLRLNVFIDLLCVLLRLIYFSELTLYCDFFIPNEMDQNQDSYIS